VVDGITSATADILYSPCRLLLASPRLGLVDGDNSGMDSFSVDIVIPVYNEDPEALALTLRACEDQTRTLRSILVVDDGSRVPAELPTWAAPRPEFCLITLPENRGISAARNAAMRRSSATYVACVNVEVLPQPDWVAVCADYLNANPSVGACYTQTVPRNPEKLLTRWRVRFQDARYPDRTGPAPFAHGHAVLFRRAAVDAIGGYDERFRVANEDWDISNRLWKQGWEVHFIGESHCVSIQSDTLKTLATKQLRDNGWSSAEESSLMALVLRMTKWTVVRASRNVAKLRWQFLPVDAALWGGTVWLATMQKVKWLLARKT